jgi:site-specific DNA-methyltransferase (adenine-specific)
VGTKTPKQVTNAGSYVPEGQAHTCKLCGGWQGKLGREPSLNQYIENLVEIFREVRRVLKPDGVCWCNIGDSFSGSQKGWSGGRQYQGMKQNTNVGSLNIPPPKWHLSGLKHKDMLCTPWRLGLALQEDGWWLRMGTIWEKPNTFVESVRDRPTLAHEYVLQLTKNERYYYDNTAVMEPTIADADGRKMRNLRSIWRIPHTGGPGHHAVFPPKLVQRCVRLTSRPGDIVLDPFVGSGTTVMVANQERRVGVGLDISFEYCDEHAVQRAAQGAAAGSQTVLDLNWGTP